MGLTTAGEYYLKSKVSGLSNKKLFSKNNIINSKPLKVWQHLLDLSHWSIFFEPIDEMQVLDDLYGNMPGNEFVGIAIDFKNQTGVIYHTRSLNDDDIVHELLHVRFPEWSEEEVNYWTDLIIEASDTNMLRLNTHSYLEEVGFKLNKLLLMANDERGLKPAS